MAFRGACGACAEGMARAVGKSLQSIGYEAGLGSNYLFQICGPRPNIFEIRALSYCCQYE